MSATVLGDGYIRVKSEEISEFIVYFFKCINNDYNKNIKLYEKYREGTRGEQSGLQNIKGGFKKGNNQSGS